MSDLKKAKDRIHSCKFKEILPRFPVSEVKTLFRIPL